MTLGERRGGVYRGFTVSGDVLMLGEWGGTWVSYILLSGGGGVRHRCADPGAGDGGVFGVDDTDAEGIRGDVSLASKLIVFSQTHLEYL